MSSEQTKICIPYLISMGWGEIELLKPQVHTSVTFNGAQKNAVGFSFNDEGIHLDQESDKFTKTKYVGFSIPAKLPAKLPQDVNGNNIGTSFIGYNNQLRGFIRKDKDTKAVMIAYLAGSTKIFDFPYDQEFGDTKDSLNNPDYILNMFSIVNVAPVGDPFKYPKLPPYEAKILLIIERKNKQADISITLDRLDVEATYSAPDE